MGSAVVISPRVEQRKNLEQFLEKLPRFATSVEGFISLRDANVAMTRANPPEVIFVSEELGYSQLKEFITWLKQGKFGKRICFIGICGAQETDSERIGELLASGAHGVLREPFTYQAIEDALEASKSFKSQGTKLRLKTAAALFLTSAVDRMTAEQGLPTNTKDVVTKVRDACKDYKRLTGESLTLEAIRPEGKGIETYTGVSKRVRELYEMRLKSLIGKLFKTPAG